MTIWIITAAAITINTLFVWPQALKLLRSRNLAGVSPGTWTISVALFSAWSAFALSTSYWTLFIANVSCLIGAGFVMFVGISGGWSRKWLALSFTGVLLAAFFGVVLPAVLAVVITGGAIVLRIPQLMMLFRAKEVTGVSSQTWVLSGGAAACWLVVSIHKGAVAVAIASATSVAVTLVLVSVLALRWTSSRR